VSRIIGKGTGPVLPFKSFVSQLLSALLSLPPLLAEGDDCPRDLWSLYLALTTPILRCKQLGTLISRRAMHMRVNFCNALLRQAKLPARPEIGGKTY